VLGQSFFSQPLTQNIVLISPLFLLISISRFLWAFRVRTECKWGEALDALTVLLGLTWVVAQACVLGLICRKGVFLRTPKQGAEPSIFAILRVVQIEAILGLTCFAGAVAIAAGGSGDVVSARNLTAALLLWQAATYMAALRAGAWSYVQGRRQSIPRFQFTFRSVEHRFGRYVTEGRAAAYAVAIALFFGGLFYLGYERSPQSERTQLADPLKRFLPARSVLAPSPKDLAGAVLVQEADAAQSGDVASALRLWAPDGVIVDVSIPMAPREGLNVWKGIDQIRARYLREFGERNYRFLQHKNLKIDEEGDNLTIVNDLDATIRTEGQTRHLNLPGTDKWTLRRDGEGWQIVRLEVNKAWSRTKSIAELER
jgi:ketosteroid isomerase-like protein